MYLQSARERIDERDGSFVESLVLLYLVFFLVNMVAGSYRIEQGGTNWEINAYSSSSDADDWYPGSLAENQHFTVAPYTDTGSSDYSVIFHTGADLDRQKELDIVNPPTGSSVLLSDDSGEFTLSQEPEGQWSWTTSEIDGGVLTQGGSWQELEIDPDPAGPNLILSHPGGSIDLDDDQNFFIRRNDPPEVESLDSPADGARIYGTSTSLEATVSDPQGSSETLTVAFYNNRTGDLIDSDTVTGDTSGVTATVDWTWPDSKRGKDLRWHVRVTDGYASDQSDTNSSFHVNALPNINRIHPEDGGLVPQEKVNLWTITEDPEGSPVTVYFFDASDDTLIGKDSAGPDMNASTEWSGLEQGTIYSWYVNASDGNENLTSLTWSFKRSLAENFRARVRIQYRYTHIIASPENPSYFFFTVENRVDEPKNLNTTLSGVNAEFVGDGWREYTLEGNSEKRFQVRVAPETTGSDLELGITTENQQFGLTQTETIPVYSRETVAASMSREVPGIGLLQLLAIGLLSTVLASASL